MEKQRSNHISQLTSQVGTPKTKQPWRKPTVSFMPLHLTAQDIGSISDGQQSEFQPASG